MEDFGTSDVLRVRDLPEPAVPADGYVVQILAASVNYADVVERRGRYRKSQPLPSCMGKEAAGIVVERGPEATEFEVGDPVIVVRMSNGCYAEKVAAEAHEVLRPPRSYSFLEMAAFAVSFGTAWFAMHQIARVRFGDTALIQAAAGGVGSAAVALARSGGCSRVIGLAGGPHKCAVAVREGADACFDYLAGDFRPGVLEITGGTGVDYCLESVGGEVYDRSLDVIAPMGHLVIIGFSSVSADYGQVIPRLHPLTVFQRSISVGGLNVDNIAFTRQRDTWARLIAHVEDHGLRPLIGPVLPFTEIRAAHELIESRRSTGKVVLVLDEAATTTPERRTVTV
jgi:NADPH2:quinone reductase